MISLGDPGPALPEKPDRLGLLRDRDFRGLFLSTTVAQFGYQITSLALPLAAVIALDVSEFEVGVLSSMSMIAFLLIGLPAGAWIDRMRRRRVLIVSDLVRAAVLLTVPIAWWTDTLTIWHLYAVALIIGVFTVFFDVSYQSYLPHLVGRKHLVEGNAKLESVRSTAQLGGPVLAGQLIEWLTAPVALAFDAVAMGASALFLVRIRRREPKPEVVHGSKVITEVREGLRFVLRERLLASIVACTGSWNFWMGASMAMLVVFLPRDMGMSPGEIGLFFALSGVGGVVGAFTVGAVTRRLGEGRTIWVSVAVTSPLLFLIPAAEPGWRIWVGAFAMTFVGIGGVVYNVTQVSFRQRLTPDGMLGRMNATVRFVVYGAYAVGALLGGVLGQFLGARTTLWIGAAGICLAFLPVFFSPLRNMRELPDPEHEEARAAA
ncbi:MFS transporter [Glycomyces harbinensis]|uniref:Predicted arabinose efflux permease, MFS family n=1 Tax=Glycomyces harbinensis TaxID=58114 RepID=A0A1G7AG92_9ACTN|nr:MFS transporter [Glycomyces harbinensis]SDE13958.1 Predicted arabinose efflux permease, MFS family [Glycomyces harbinensis]